MDTASVDSLIQQYYTALDTHEYDRLEAILHPAFVQHRPDRTFDSRAAFLTFMETGRPNPETDHELGSVVTAKDRAAVRGRLLDDGQELFEFADFFRLEEGQIIRLDTYTR